MKNDLEPSGVFDGVEVYWIPGWEGFYSVSKCGKVWSHERRVEDPRGGTRKVRGRWRLQVKNQGGYLFTSLSKRGKLKMHRLHRILAETFLGAGEGSETDHRNGDKLDNRLENLRVATKTQNCWNTRSRKGSSSKFKGVSFRKDTGKWRAYISPSGVYRHLGDFESEEDAARAYDRAAAKLQGEFACPNFPSDPPS